MTSLLKYVDSISELRSLEIRGKRHDRTSAAGRRCSAALCTATGELHTLVSGSAGGQSHLSENWAKRAEKAENAGRICAGDSGRIAAAGRTLEARHLPLRRAFFLAERFLPASLEVSFFCGDFLDAWTWLAGGRFLLAAEDVLPVVCKFLGGADANDAHGWIVLLLNVEEMRGASSAAK